MKQAVESSFKKGVRNVYVEIGPSPVLRAHMGDIFQSNTPVCIPTMKRKEGVRSVYEFLAEMYQQNSRIDWNRVQSGSLVEIPKYHFNKVMHLYRCEEEVLRLQGHTHDAHSHQFVRRIPNDEKRFKVLVDKSSTGYAYDHKLSGTVLVPGSTYVEIALEIGSKVLNEDVHGVQVSTEFLKPLTPASGRKYELLAEVTEGNRDKKEHRFTIFMNETHLMQGVFMKRTMPIRTPIDIESIRSNLGIVRTSEESYGCLERLGFTYGESLRLIGKSWSNGKEVLAELTVPEVIKSEIGKTNLHPAVLDGVFQILGILATLFKGGENTTGNNKGVAVLPKGVGNIVVNLPIQGHMFGYAKEMMQTEKTSHYNVMLLSQKGDVIAEILDFNTKLVSTDDDTAKDIFYSLDWMEIQPAGFTEKAKTGKYILITGNNNVANVLKSTLPQAEIQTCITKSSPEGLIAGRELIKETFAKVKEDSIDVEAVVFALGHTTDEVVRGGKGVYEHVRSSFLAFSDLVKSLVVGRIRSPVYVLTEATQVVKGLTEKRCNVLGSELWGCVRSLMWETDIDARLIDVHPRLEANEHLRYLLTDPQEFLEHKEVVLVTDRIFVSQFKFTKNATIVPYFRSAFRDKSVDVRIMSTSSKPERSNSFLALHKCDEAFDSIKYELIETDRVCLHNADVYPTVVEGTLSGNEIWGGYNQEPHEVLTLELQGFRCAPGYVEPKSLTFESQANRIPVIVCYPTSAMSKVVVPKSCIVDARTLPHYIPGIMTLASVVWYISKKVPLNSAVCLVQEGPPNPLSLLLAVILKKKRKAKLLPRNGIGLRNENSEDSKTVIVLSKLGPKMEEDLSVSLMHVNLLLSLRQFLPTDLERRLLSKNMMLSVQNIDTVEILRPAVLERIVPKVAGWLQNVDKFQLKAMSFIKGSETVTEQIINDEELFALPLPTFDVSGRKKAGMKEYKMVSVREAQLFRKENCYVVIGGLSGLGWEIMNQLAEEGAGYIVSLSRRAPGEDVQFKLDDIMRKYGCQILCLRADITDIVSVQAAFNNINLQLPKVPVRGLFHGGAVLADSLLATMTDEQAIKALAPKVQGSWNLHLVTKDLCLDFFVMHSSMVSILGNVGQTNYGAGNAFMDSLADYRRSIGLSGISLNWGALDVGMAKSDAHIEETLKERGFLTLTSAQIRNCLKHALMNNRPQNVYGSFIWGTLGSDPSIERQSAKLKPVLNSTSKKSKTKITERRGSKYHLDMQKYMASTEEEKLVIVLDVVFKTVEEVFVVGNDSLTEHTQFVGLGADSMTAMSFVNIVFEVTNCRIPVVQLLSGDTSLRDIANYLLENITDAADVELPEEVAEVFSRPITFMQDIVLEDMLRDPSNTTNRHIYDFEFFSFELQTEYWEKIFCHLLKMHPQLRTVFQHGGEKINPVVTPPEEVVVDFKVVDMAELDINKTSDVDPRLKYSFDLTKNFPIKFLLAQSADRTVVRVVTHKIISDIITANLIFRDIQRIGMCMMNASDLPTDVYDMDFQAELKRSLQASLPNLQSYWKERLESHCDPLSIGPDVNVPIDANYNAIVERDVTRKKSEAVYDYIEKNGLTLYQFMASLYQLLLHSLTGSITIPIVTSVDMRMHVPHLRNMITRCINRFPVIATIPTRGTVEEYVQQNAKQIQDDVSNNAYPFSLIKAEMTEDLRAQLQRHVVVMDNMSNLTTSASDGAFRARIKNVVHANTNHETVMYVKYDLQEKTLGFEFGYNLQVISKEKGVSILDQFMQMIEQFLVNPTSGLDNFVLTTQQTNGSISSDGTSNIMNQNTQALAKGRRMSKQLPLAIRRASLTSEVSQDDFRHLQKINNRRESKENRRRASMSSIGQNSYQTIEEASVSQLTKQNGSMPNGKPVQKQNGYISSNGEGHNGVGYKQQNGYHTSTSNGYAHVNGSHGVQQKIHQPGLVKTDEFFKQTTEGWDHKVHLYLRQENGTALLEWHKPGKEKSGKGIHALPVEELEGVHLTELNGLSVILLKSKDRMLIFKTSNQQLAAAWAGEIASVLAVESTTL